MGIETIIVVFGVVVVIAIAVVVMRAKSRLAKRQAPKPGGPSHGADGA